MVQLTVNFSISKDKLKKFIDYISIEPVDENDHKSSYKYPYFASEILASENVFIIDKFFEEEEEVSSRQSDETEKDETKNKFRRSSIIEINMVDDSNTVNENENKDNTHNSANPISEPNTESTKDNKLLNFLSSDEKEEENDEKTTENKDSNLENIVPDINENLKGEVKKDNDEKEDENNVNENNQSKSSLHEEKKKIYNTLDYLFNFLSNKGPLNFVLCGYFQKIFNHLANYKNACVNNYLII